MALYTRRVYIALHRDLSKAFVCLPHDLIIAKLPAYHLDMSSLRFTQSYLKDRYHRVKANSSYSLWSLIKYEVHQGSILDPILVNIFLCGLFFLVDSVDIQVMLMIIVPLKWHEITPRYMPFPLQS